MIVVFIIAFFFIILLMGLPVAIALGLSSIIYILVSGEFSYLLNIPQRMYVATDNFSLLAIPFFMLVGELMNYGGVTHRLIHLFRSILGHIHGSLAYVNIVTSGFLSSIIGSTNAVASITSSSIVPEMRKEGYSNEYSSAVSAASSIMGTIIPPSIIFIIYAVAASTSVEALFLAGIIPGITLMSAFCLIAFLYARKHKFPTQPKQPAKTILKNVWSSLPAISIPVIIMVGIISGIFTATEAGAIGCLIAFIIGKFIYKEIQWRDIPKILFRSSVITATIMIIAATASLFGWIMTIEQIPQMIANAILSISDSKIVILLLINMILLMMGMFLDPFSSILILVPIFLPIIAQLGIDPVHFGLMMCFNLSIGMITPPVGLSLFIVSGVTKVPIDKLIRAVIPYVAVSIAVLLVITYVPELSLFLPNLFSK